MHEQVKTEQPSTAYLAVVTYKSGEKTLARADDEGRLVTPDGVTIDADDVRRVEGVL